MEYKDPDLDLCLIPASVTSYWVELVAQFGVSKRLAEIVDVLRNT